MNRVSDHTIIEQFSSVKEFGLLNEFDSSFIFYDFNVLKHRLEQVKTAFGAEASHTVAVKSNPLGKVLRFIADQRFGLECASFEEVKLAQHAGATIIAWDSPAKADHEIIASNEVSGLHINANSLHEVSRILKQNSNSDISLRINPLHDTGSHRSMSVAGKHSKFGEPLSNIGQIKEAIIEANGRISGLHVHSSSQTSEFAQLASAIRKVVDLANQINIEAPDCIKTINIGGGFPAEYRAEEHFDIRVYADLVKADCPELFDGTYGLITEFGRFYHANASWTASQIHEVRSPSKGHQVIVIHVGADQFVREAYNPGLWHHDMFLFPKRNEHLLTSDIGGPLCFGGDFIALGIELQPANNGDWLFIKDTGANSIALWSRHCSRTVPKVIGHYADNGKHSNFTILKERESFDDILKFWG